MNLHFVNRNIVIIFVTTKYNSNMNHQNAKVRKKKIVRDEVFRKILDDHELRDRIMEATGLRDDGVRAFAYRKSQKRIMDINIMNAIKKHTKWTDKEIFTTV